MDQLVRHCRICGGKLQKAKGRSQAVYPCEDHSFDLQSFVGVSSTPDEGDTPGCSEKILCSIHKTLGLN